MLMSKNKLLEQYADVFSGLGKLPEKYNVNIDIHISYKPEKIRICLDPPKIN